ncbi:hypothetical protein JCM14076_32080 [Methylosoma difficile]|jgi:hypothetical protein
MITQELANLWESAAKEEEKKWDNDNQARYKSAFDCLDGWSAVAEGIKHDRREHMKNFTIKWWNNIGYTASFDEMNNLSVF